VDLEGDMAHPLHPLYDHACHYITPHHQCGEVRLGPLAWHPEKRMFAHERGLWWQTEDDGKIL